MRNLSFPIDIVITWVDQSDSEWQKKYSKFKASDHDEDSGTRFRDYGTLQYVFRSIEKYAPWVHKVFLVTDNQWPSWLDEGAKKIVCVKHSDYLNPSLLPTFDSNTIELGFQNISDLSEHFICFNDDDFLNRPTKPEDFFDVEGNPRDTLALNAIMPMSIFDHIHVNNLRIINHDFSKRSTMRHLFFKFFNVKNGPWNLFSLLLCPWPRFTRFYDPHIPISFRKSTYADVLEKHPEILRETGLDRFRSERDYSQWVIRYVQMLTGRFSVRRYNFGVQYSLHDWEKAITDIKKSKHSVLNINDSNELDQSEFEHATEELAITFRNKFSKKSQFEK